MFSTITTPPAKQSVSETIPILSGRLSTATLLEDRRAAILGLRSFAKQYPASVASGALRSLIGSLDRDGEDVDTVKVVLETLLMLFSPAPDSPEASEEIALWVADEFTQRHENIGLLLGFLGKDNVDFYSRLYSLQLLSAILAARTERTEECIVNAEDGISRLVAVLDEQREAIRNEAVGLLTDLTPTSTVVQGLVAFENVFGRVFGIIKAEGGLAFGERVVEDCLILLANLLRLNATNQAMFRDMGYVAEIGRLLREAYGSGGDGEEVAQWVEAQRNRNVYALLAVVRLFLVPGASVTALNQEAFLGDLIQNDRGRGGRASRARNDPVLVETLQIAFSHAAELPIKSEALLACADMIRGNEKAQLVFAGIQVPSPLDGPAANGHPHGITKVYVIDGLLDLVLAVNTLQAFDLRLAGCVCLKAYFHKHAEIRNHFLTIAIDGHKANVGQHTNILTILLQPQPEVLTADPYKYWFAAVLMLHLLHGNPEAKARVMSVTEGDEASGEEVVTSIQTVAAHLLSSVSKSEDPRVIIGYLMLLLCWLFEDLKAVNDFLDEFTNLQGLIQAAVENPHGDVIVQGLSAMLAGVVYEFSTKDSPVPRVTVREMIITRMGRDRYIDKLSKLRSYPLMRDYEVLPQRLEASLDQKLPEVFFDDTFVEFFKDNYNRILRAIDRDPDSEAIIIIDGVQKGVSRQLVDSLREEIAERDKVLQELSSEKKSLVTQLSQEQAAHNQTKSLQSTNLAQTSEIVKTLKDQLTAKDRSIQTAEAHSANLNRQLHAEQAEHQRAKGELARATEAANSLQSQLAVRNKSLQAAEAQTAHLKQQLTASQAETRRTNAEISRLKSVNEGLHKNHEAELKKLRATHDEELQKLRAEHITKEEDLRRQLDTVKKSAEQETERVRRRLEAEQADLKATISRLEVDLMKGNKTRSDSDSKIAQLEVQLKKEKEKVEAKEKSEQALKKKLEEKEAEVKEANKLADDKEEERSTAQSELDDLLMVFGDLEERASKYKERLKALGETVSDGEDDDDHDDDDDDDEEEDEG